MKIAEALERDRSKRSIDKIVGYIGDDTSRFGELIQIFVTGPDRMTQRAAWPLSLIVERYPDLIKLHYPAILRVAKRPGIHPAILRSVIRLLQFVQIPKRYQGQVAELCFDCLADRSQPVAPRAFAMSVIANLSEFHPPLKEELKLVIEENLPYASPAFLSRARKVLKNINFK